MQSHSFDTPRGPESREAERSSPVLTAYVLRHGETTEDKLNPNRGLTLEGEKQMDQAAERLITELDPERDMIQIFDSGNQRALVSVMRIAEQLKAARFLFFEPIRVDSRKNFLPTEEGVRTTPEPRARPMVRGIGAARIPNTFKQQLSDPVWHKVLGIVDDIPDKRIATWMLGEWPDEVESPKEVAIRVETAIVQAQARLPMLARQLGLEKRIVVIGAANATAIDAAIVGRTGVPVTERGGETSNAEGFKIDFSLAKEPKFSVWGEKIERYFEDRD